MRDKIIALVMCGLLAVSLFACGEQRGTSNDSDTLGDEQNYTSGANNGSTNGSSNGSSNGGNGMTGGSTNGGSSSNGGSMTGGSSSNGGSSSSGTTSGMSGTNGNNGSNGTNADQGSAMGDSALHSNTINPANGTVDRTATWEQMLQNGRVHDTDGYLFDGENTHWA